MNDEKRIRDLMRRLAAMSPEPPDFPEETLMARHTTSKSRPNPVLMFAAGAALVAAVMVPVFLLARGEAPVGVGTTTTTTATTSTTVAPSSTTAVETTTTTPETSTTTAPVAAPWVGTVFLYQTPESSFLGNPALVPVQLVLNEGPLPNAPFTEALATIGQELPELSTPLSNSIPGDVRIVDLSVGSNEGTDVWVADMNEEFVAGAGGLLADITMINQLVYTITYGEGTDAGVLFTVNGQPVEAFGSEGLDLTEPVYRESFIEDLAPIFLTEPITELENVYLVSGMANVFEASLTIRVLDGDDEVVHEEPVQASCGSGCWGEFGVGVASELIVPGESKIQLFTHSAEDGSMTNVLTVPIPADSGVWEITVG